MCKVCSLAGLADVVPVAALEDPRGRDHLVKADLQHKNQERKKILLSQLDCENPEARNRKGLRAV